MGDKKKGGHGLVDPTTLDTIDKDRDLLQVIVETPKGSRNKYSFDTELRLFSLKQTLPAGMAFPYDFGFLPRTLADDGDPIDVLLLMDEPAYPGVMVRARLVGVIEGEQIDGKKRIRNDRLVAVSDGNTEYAHIEALGDVPKKWLQQLEDFFVNYHKLQGKEYRLLGCKDAAEGRKLIHRAQKAA